MMKRILYIFSAALLMASCKSEVPEVPVDKQQSIELSMAISHYEIITTNASTRAADPGSAAEQAVNDFYLFLFPGGTNPNPVRSYYIVTATGTVTPKQTPDSKDGTYDNGVKKISLNLSPSVAGERDVYIVANTAGNSTLQTALDAVTTLAQLQAVLTSTNTPWSGVFTGLATPILMSGGKTHNFTGNRVLGSDAVGGTNEPLRLVRAFAKVELNVILQDEHKDAAIAKYKYKYTNFDKNTYVVKPSLKPDDLVSSTNDVWPTTAGWTPWGTTLDAATGTGSAHTILGGVVTTLKLVTYINERDNAGTAIEIEVPYNGSGPLPPPEFGPELYKLEFPEGIQRNHWYVLEIEI